MVPRLPFLLLSYHAGESPAQALIYTALQAPVGSGVWNNKTGLSITLCSDLPGLIGKEGGVGGREGSLGGPAQRAFVTLIECAGGSGVGEWRLFISPQVSPVTAGTQKSRDRKGIRAQKADPGQGCPLRAPNQNAATLVQLCLISPGHPSCLCIITP